MSKDSGGDAFPSPGVVIDYDKNEHQQGAYSGMSLRDYFAAKAMQAAITGISNMDLEDAERVCLMTSHLAYVIADAMLAERAK